MMNDMYEVKVDNLYKLQYYPPSIAFPYTLRLHLYDRVSYYLLIGHQAWQKTKYIGLDNGSATAQSNTPIKADVIFEQSITNPSDYVCIKLGNKEQREPLFLEKESNNATIQS